MKTLFIQFIVYQFFTFVQSSPTTDEDTEIASNLIRPQWRRSSGNIYTSYESSVYCSADSPIQFPKDVEELTKIVEDAISDGKTVKAIGNRHSVTDIICTDGIPISMNNFDYKLDHGDGTVTFGAGIELFEVMKFLEGIERSLIQIPSYAGITLGGSIGTGAHGSSLIHPTTISEQMVALTIIDGTGEIRKITAEKDLNAFRPHLGLLGIVINITLETVPLFKMTVHNNVESESILLDGTALSWAREFDWFQMWWFPSTKQVVVSKGVNTDDLSIPGTASTNFIPNVTPLEIATVKDAYEALQATRSTLGLYALEEFAQLSLFSQVFGKPPIFSEDGTKLKNPATGFGWRLQSNKCTNKCAWNNGDRSVEQDGSSVAFDLEELPRVIKMMKDTLKIAPASFPMIGVFIRFLKASPGLMAISNRRPTFTIDLSTPKRNNSFKDARDGLTAYQAILQTMIQNHGGRPHWGKNGLHYFTNNVLKQTTPNRKFFINAMRKFDPEGIFLNKFGKRILGISNAFDIDPRVTHCALQDYCICKTSSDCGTFQVCSKLNGFSVCKDALNIPSRPLPVKGIQIFNSILSSLND